MNFPTRTSCGVALLWVHLWRGSSSPCVWARVVEMMFPRCSYQFGDRGPQVPLCQCRCMLERDQQRSPVLADIVSCLAVYFPLCNIHVWIWRHVEKMYHITICVLYMRAGTKPWGCRYRPSSLSIYMDTVSELSSPVRLHRDRPPFLQSISVAKTA